MVRSDRESYGVSIGIVSRGWTYECGNFMHVAASDWCHDHVESAFVGYVCI